MVLVSTSTKVDDGATLVCFILALGSSLARGCLNGVVVAHCRFGSQAMFFDVVGDDARSFDDVCSDEAHWLTLATMLRTKLVPSQW
ncbi:hypothetical protein DEO72_LG5g2788 [Vigna unguiculata]|uniref:Uncharacterized protein n=1 Tax=Vigna unguiculata TaxID=3917 RepID=A0A4D6M1Q0_VIGUN|nr:hypothetical protein DEO72_LG5g2788 [Vigna unguiculata]